MIDKTYPSLGNISGVNMIILKSHGKTVLSIERSSFIKILSIYPDESLHNREIFNSALQVGEISFSDLKKECETVCLPWQLFLLEPQKLDRELSQIDELRKSKFDDKMIATRDNEGRGVSLRIADRLIALQDFAREGVSVDNKFCGSLKKLPENQWADYIIRYFSINPENINKGKKGKTLDYLIRQVEARNIRVSRGVFNSNKLLPIGNDIRKTYRKSSGFVVRDNRVPYIFLPSELNTDETPGRQILTLVSLLVLIGMDQYSIYIQGNFEVKIKKNKLLKLAFKISGEILLPLSATSMYTDVAITDIIRDELAEKYMLTPSAVIVTFRERGHLKSDEEFEALTESINRKPQLSEKTPMKTPFIQTSVKKLCGQTTSQEIIDALRSSSLSNVKAQYLMFGYVDKLKFERFKSNVEL